MLKSHSVDFILNSSVNTNSLSGGILLASSEDIAVVQSLATQYLRLFSNTQALLHISQRGVWLFGSVLNVLCLLYIASVSQLTSIWNSRRNALAVPFSLATFTHRQ